MSMYANLAAIMGDVGRIEKKGQIKSFGSGPSYKYARDSDVMEAVTPRMAEVGIVMVPEQTELLSTTLTMSEKQYVSNIKTRWLVTDGTDELRFETFGQGADTGDKALPKAQSNARKYAFFMLYHIVTGDDPDIHGSEDQSERGSGQSNRGSSPSRPSRSGGATADQSAVTPAPAQYRREELAALAHEKGLDRKGLERYAAIVGIPENTRATDEQMDALIDAVRGHGEDQPIESATHPPVAEESTEPEGAPSGPPPKPGTDEYAALPAPKKAAARAYWAKEPEQASLAEQLGAPAA